MRTHPPARTRTIPVNSSTAVVLQANALTRQALIGAAVSTTQFDLDASASSVDDFYNGLYGDFVSGTGAGQLWLVTDYTGASKRITVSAALTTQPATTTTFRLGPGLPSAWTSLTFGGAANDIYYSYVAGGTAGTNRITIPAGEYRILDSIGSFTDYLEILSSAATDNVHIEWN